MTMRNVGLRRFGCYGAAAVVGLIYAGCSTEHKEDPFVGRVIERPSSTSEALSPATALTTMWRTDFTSLNATGGAPNSAYDWVFELFEPNGEVEQYTSNVCNGNNNPVGTNWNYCVQSGQSGTTDGYALQIRAQNDGGTIHSGRLNSKRMHEYAPTANVGLQYEASIKFDANSINQGAWPAFWMLQRNINEAPVIGDTDNAPWPCLGAQEVDIMEMGSLGGTWSNSYNQSSLHYDTGGCYPQGPNANPSVNNNWAHQLDDGNYHKYTMEFECGSSCSSSATMRFFVDGAQEGGDVNVTGAGYDQVASFFIINMAVGGGLGGTVNYGAYNNPGRSMFVDYLNVASYNPSNRGGGGGGTVYRDIHQHLAAAGNDGASGVQFETCTEGGQDAGWIGNGSQISWNVAVPAGGNYFVQTRDAVNNGGANATYDIYVDGTYKVSNSIANTGGWQNWATYNTGAFVPGAGNHTLKIVFTSGGQNLEYAQLIVSDTCNDGVQNQGETGIDCGGPCPACQAVSLGSTVQALNASYFSTSDLQKESGHLSYWHPAAYARYDNVNMSSVAGLTIAYATQNAGQVFEVRAGNGCNATTGTVLGDFTMPTTASWTSYTQAALNFGTTVNLTTSLCLIGKSSNTLDMMNLQWFTLTSGSGTQTGTGPTCSDGIQNQGELGVDCGGPCAACPAGAMTLQAVSANSITGATADGSVGEVLNNGSSSLCWNNVNMSGNTSATVKYGNLQSPNNTVQVTYNGSNLGSAIPIVNTDGWATFSSASTSFGAQSGSGTLCVKVGTYAGSGAVAEVASVTVGTSGGSPPPPPCQPATCSSKSYNCGSAPDGCGGTLSCGSCGSGQSCQANVCTSSSTPACGTGYASGNWANYTTGTVVSTGGHNWQCSNANCSNCGTYASCGPGSSGCPWGTVWSDQGACH
jgi:hypothetical protein